MDKNQTKTALAPAKKDALAPRRTVCLNAEFGRVYVQERGGRILEPIKSDMTLFSKLGQLYEQDGKVLITAPGYRHLNKAAAISIVNASSVVVDGVTRANPYIDRNPQTKAVEGVAIRKLGIGFAPTGQVVVVDKTLYFNTFTYFLQSIQAKMGRMVWEESPQTHRRYKTDKREFPDCAEYGVKDQPPAERKAPSRWVFYPIEGPLGVWVNFLDGATLECLKEHTQRQRFGERIASTIIDRNIFKDHPAIAVTEVFGKLEASSEPAGDDQEEAKGKWQKKARKEYRATVTVYGWRNSLEARDISALLKQAEIDQADNFKGQVIAGVVSPEPAELKAAEAEVVQEEGPDIETPGMEQVPGDDIPADAAELFFKDEKQAEPPATTAPAEKRFTPADRAQGERPK